MNRALLGSIIALCAALVLAFLYFYPLQKSSCSVTCSEDKQCGGSIAGERICKGSSVYATKQVNVCLAAGTCNSVCETSFTETFVEECPAGCLSGACLPNPSQ